MRLAQNEEEYSGCVLGGIPVSPVVESRAALSPGRRPGVDAQRPAEAEYDFLLGRHVNAVAALKWLLAWDPFNVTEDADLGTRLARSGYRCAVINSTTYEEAPPRFGGWIRQRTRWLKGFVQTWLVHMREPRALWQELGPRGFFAFQVMVGGTILSALVHPWFYVLLAGEMLGGNLLALPGSLIGAPFWRSPGSP